MAKTAQVEKHEAVSNWKSKADNVETCDYGFWCSSGGFLSNEYRRTLVFYQRGEWWQVSMDLEYLSGSYHK
ncbi:MAG: hypothetical protein JRN15_05920 [Nitrososphaerota archaeon]|nr:hypothetical protein [Nitrososphaerota archaeon]